MTRVLVIAAHPDDEVLGMGGTIAVHTSGGDDVRVLVVTDGSSTQYPGDAEIRSRKEQEAVSAANELGVQDYVHLDLPDMRLDTLEHVVVNEIVEEHVRDHAPEVVYTVHPDVNRDHQVLFDSVAVATRPTPWSSRKTASHLCADIQHRVDARGGQLVPAQLVRRHHRNARAEARGLRLLRDRAPRVSASAQRARDPRRGRVPRHDLRPRGCGTVPPRAQPGNPLAGSPQRVRDFRG